MDLETYFGTVVVTILTVLTFITLILAFLYLTYGKEETSTQS